jgi:competence protein CoiA
MLSAYNRLGEQVVAWEAIKENGPFTCPECGEAVIVKKGSVVMHHFAHSAPSKCQFGSGESAEHWRAKFEIYEALRKHPSVTRLMVERNLGSVRPDVSFCLAGVHVALELQRSTLSQELIAQRTRIYTAKYIHVLWMPLFNREMVEGKRYAPLYWEKYLHALYYGKIYYWVFGATMLPVHFDEFRVGEAYHRWFDKARGMWVDGYRSRRFRTLSFFPTLTITDLHAVKRDPWQSGSFSLPAARLWCLPKDQYDDRDGEIDAGEQTDEQE